MKKAKHSKHYSILFFAVFNLFCFSLLAQQDTSNLSKQITQLLATPFEQLVNMPVSSASKFSQKPSDAPCNVSIISRDNMDQNQWTSLDDIAAQQAGFTLGQDRYGMVIDSRGITDLLWSNRLLVLFDGVPFSSFTQNVTDNALSLNMAQSVEMIRGPGSVLYGSQAVTGVMSVNSMSASDLKGNSVLELKGGDYSYHSINLLTGTQGKYANTIISFNNFGTNGNEYESYDLLTSPINLNKQMTQDQQNSTHFFLKIEGKDKFEGFSLSYHFQEYNFQMGQGFLDIIPSNPTPSQVTRNYLVAKYVTPHKPSTKLIQEYVLQYDYEVDNYFLQIIPSGLVFPNPQNGKPDSALYSGWNEHYITPVNHGFARAQWIYSFDSKATLLGGVEQDMIYYNGDLLHVSNVNILTKTLYPDGNLESVGPLYETIDGHPVNNSAVYGQFSSGSILGNKLTATIGARYDIYYYNYTSLTTFKDTTRTPITHFSPRVALVYAPEEDFAIKAMYSNAFRVASPFEQFVTNSLISNTGTNNLQPEILTNYELVAYWSLQKNVIWQNSLFYSDYTNIITLSNNPGGSEFANTSATTQDGFESELHCYFNDFSAYANYSFVQRTRETTNDPYLVTSNTLVWYPSSMVKAGITWYYKKFDFTLDGQYQGVVKRDSTENGVSSGLNTVALRGNEVAPWLIFNVNINYHITSKISIRIASTNIFNTTYFLDNTAFDTSTPVPFDYQQPGRRVMVSLKFVL